MTNCHTNFVLYKNIMQIYMSLRNIQFHEEIHDFINNFPASLFLRLFCPSFAKFLNFKGQLHTLTPYLVRSNVLQIIYYLMYTMLINFIDVKYYFPTNYALLISFKQGLIISKQQLCAWSNEPCKSVPLWQNLAGPYIGKFLVLPLHSLQA